MRAEGGDKPTRTITQAGRRYPIVAGAGAAALLALLVADGIRNRAPDDALPAERGPDAAEDVPASFPQTIAAAGSSSRADRCGGAGGGPAVTQPVAIGDQGRWLTSIDYPLASLAAGHEGVSAMALTVGRNGMLADCRIVGSSGHAPLDAAACAMLRARARYEPARDAAGCAVPTMIRQRVRWQIPIE